MHADGLPALMHVHLWIAEWICMQQVPVNYEGL